MTHGVKFDAHRGRCHQRDAQLTLSSTRHIPLATPREAQQFIQARNLAKPDAHRYIGAQSYSLVRTFLNSSDCSDAQPSKVCGNNSAGGLGSLVSCGEIIPSSTRSYNSFIHQIVATCTHAKRLFSKQVAKKRVHVSIDTCRNRNALH